MQTLSRARLGAALLVLSLIPPTLAAQLAVTSMTRVAADSGVRDRPSVAIGRSSYAVFWEEAPTMTPSTVPGSNYRILRQEVAFDGTLLGTPVVTVDTWGHQWGASPVAGRERSWLAYYFADQSMATGDRDIALATHSSFFTQAGVTHRLTEDPEGAVPTNHSSPALLLDEEAGLLALASSGGAYRGDPGSNGHTHAYDSVNIEIRLMDLDGVVNRQFVVKGPDFVGEAITPALTLLPPNWRERYVLAYVSNAGHRDKGAAGYSVYLELFNRDWRVVGGRHLSHPTGGAARPSVATVGGKLYMAWVDNATNDIVISELDQNLHPVWPMRLRTALGETGFAAQFGEGAPGLSAPMLFDSFGQLGVAFVATWEWDTATTRVRQEVFMGTVRYR